MDTKQRLACALAMALAAWAATAVAREGTTDGAPVRPTALSHHLSAVDDAVPSAPAGVSGSTGYLFVAGSAFTSRDSSNAVSYAGAGCVVSTSNYVVTDLQLPDGANVLGIRSYYYNNGQPGSVAATLTSYDGAGGFTDHVIGNSTMNTGYADEYFGAVTPPVIDNASLSYALLGKTVANTQFCGIRVFFQYP